MVLLKNSFFFVLISCPLLAKTDFCFIEEYYQINHNQLLCFYLFIIYLFNCLLVHEYNKTSSQLFCNYQSQTERIGLNTSPAGQSFSH